MLIRHRNGYLPILFWPNTIIEPDSDVERRGGGAWGGFLPDEYPAIPITPFGSILPLPNVQFPILRANAKPFPVTNKRNEIEMDIRHTLNPQASNFLLLTWKGHTLHPPNKISPKGRISWLYCRTSVCLQRLWYNGFDKYLNYPQTFLTVVCFKPVFLRLW